MHVCVRNVIDVHHIRDKSLYSLVIQFLRANECSLWKENSRLIYLWRQQEFERKGVAQERESS